VVRLLGGVDLASMQITDRVQDAVVAPLVEVTPDGALGQEIPGQIPPLGARAKMEKMASTTSRVLVLRGRPPE
jgi:hypothetical protein